MAPIADSSATLVDYNGEWYYVVDGEIAYNVTTLVEYSGEWYYVKKGKVAFDVTTLVKYNGVWHYVVNGMVASDTTTLLEYNGSWYYIVNGKLAADVTTLVNCNGQWHYVVNGRWASEATTLVEYNDVWYYVKNGKVDFSYTGTFFYGGAAYPVIKGKVIMENLHFESIYVMGAAVDTALNWLNGESWKPDAEANRATEIGDGEYSIVFYNVPAGRYEFVFAANGDEEYYWGGTFRGFDSYTTCTYWEDPIVFELSEKQDVTLFLKMSEDSLDTQFKITLSDPSTPCSHSYTTTVISPTCTEEGYAVHTCNNCADSFTGGKTPPLGHNFSDYISDGNAGCVTDGTKTATCGLCGLTKTEVDEGSALGHAFTLYLYDYNASCRQNGTKTAKCDRCDATDTVPLPGSALGHSFTNGVCDRCGQKESTRLLGDLTGDNKLKIDDVASLYTLIRNSDTVVDVQLLSYADITGDGRLNVGDVARLYAHIRGTKLLA